MQKYKKVKDIISNCHEKDQFVVFTHGVFDLFHKGHLRTINESKSIGGILIVGIDSDSLVRRLKGSSRPIIKERDRLEIVSNIKSVDFTFILEPSGKESNDLHNYFLHLYKYLQIDSVTSGNPSEYCIDQQDICKKLDIQYRLAGQEVVETTTNIIKKISKKY